MLAGAVALFVAIWNYNLFGNYMIERLYKHEKKDAKEKKYSSWDDRGDLMRPRCCAWFKEWICDKLPSCCQCCMSHPRDKAFAMGREKYEEETNIIEITRQRRYFNMAFKLLLTKRQRKRLRERSKYLLLNPNVEKGSDESDYLTDDLKTDPDNPDSFSDEDLSEKGSSDGKKKTVTKGGKDRGSDEPRKDSPSKKSPQTKGGKDVDDSKQNLKRREPVPSSELSLSDDEDRDRRNDKTRGRSHEVANKVGRYSKSKEVMSKRSSKLTRNPRPSKNSKLSRQNSIRSRDNWYESGEGEYDDRPKKDTGGKLSKTYQRKKTVKPELVTRNRI